MGLVYHVFKGGGPSARKKAFGLFVRSGSIIKKTRVDTLVFFIIGEPGRTRTISLSCLDIVCYVFGTHMALPLFYK